MGFVNRFVNLAALLSITLVTVDSTQGQDFRNSIVSTDFDFITATDPSTFKKLEYVAQRSAEMPDKREGSSLFQPAYEYKALFSDGTRVSIFIEAKGKNQKAARVEAMRFVHPLGKLPTALRSGVDRLCVHSGGRTTTAFADVGVIVMYSANASVRVANHDLEETIFHESVHAAWDATHAASEAWKTAQMKDGRFATHYAKSKPEREDLAETALFAYTLLHHPKRLPKSVRQSLRSSVYHRILFIEELLPKGKPLHYPISAPKPGIGASNDIKSLCDVRMPGIAADIISSCLFTEFKIAEPKVNKTLAGAGDQYESGEEVFQAAVKAFEVDPEELRNAVLATLHTNCKHGRGFDDVHLRKLIQQWAHKVSP